MNPLNLKVTGDTKKKERKREGKEDLSQYYEQHGTCKSIIDAISDASSMESQISCFKTIICSYESLGVNEVDVEDVVKLFLDMVYRLNSKSPLKAAILRHFSNIPEAFKTIVEKHLLTFVEAKVLSGSFETDIISEFLAFIMAWLENSSNIVTSLKPATSQIVAYLENSLSKLQLESKTEMPPTAKLQVLEALHNNVRSLMLFFQKVSNNPTIGLQELLLNFLKDDQLPLDTRSNCGILYVSTLKELEPGFLGEELVEKTCAPDDYQSRLCICGGLLNVLNGEELGKLVVLHREECSLLYYLLYKIILIEESNPADCTLVLSASRCVLLVTKCLVSLPHLLSNDMLNSLLRYLWVHLDHYMDATRHLATSSLTNVVSAGKKLENMLVFNAILNEMSVLASDKRSKHAALTALIGNLPIQCILSKSPGLVNALLESAKISTSRNNAVGSYEALMMQHFEEKSSLVEWYDWWVNPLINVFGDRPNAALDHILAAMVKIEPSVIQHIARLKKDEPDKLTSIFLIAWRIGKKLDVLKNGEIGDQVHLFDYETLAENVHNLNGDVRIACFAIITEAPKTSEEFTESELNIVKLFLAYNVNNHCAAERQKTLAYFKKFITRFKLGYDSCLRTIEKTKHKPVPALSEAATLETRLALYGGFKRWIIQFCVNNLFPGANFSRRGTALNILTLCAEHGFWEEDSQTEENVAVLLKCFLDSYEENKLLAKKLLTEVPVHIHKFDCPIRVKSFLENSMKLSASVRPIDSQSAAYFVSLLAAFPSSSDSLLAVSEDLLAQSPGSDTKNIPDLGRYLCAVILLDKLKRELEVAHQSLLKAASTGPMYGQLFVLRHLLRDVDFSLIVHSEEWKLIIQNIILAAFECDQVVSSVVNSSSPEGHLPMDFDYDMRDFAQENTGVQVTAQMLLLCSWRTVKEVSLLLGELSESIPLSTHENSGLMTEEQVLEIGEHLSTLLAETKHRGAFEQAYVGFCKLTSRLWRFPKGNLHELPRRWLDETLEDISNNQNRSATRRSAGIPFRIQALVCTELEVGGGKCFRKGITVLLNLASDPTSSVETKCHALNILRALYRHTLLGEMVSPYVAEGFTIAIQGFNATSWAERNSSTLLLSALMTRVFGVPRSRSENLCWKNKMTGRIFFQRYPSLFGVLLSHLEAASQKSLYPATYPVLLILGRLYPSSLEGTDSNLQLHKYIPLVFKCSGSNILKTRTLAAAAMVALITQNIFVNHIEEVFNTLGGFISENFTHGLLLQVLKLFRSSDIPENVEESIKDNLELWMSQIIEKMKSKNHSYVTKTTCVSILLHWTANYFANVPADLMQNIKDILFEELSTKEPCSSQYGRSVFLLYSSTLLLTLNYYKQKVNDTVKDIMFLLGHSNYDVRNVALSFLHCLLRNSENFTLKVDDACEMKFQTTNFGKKVKTRVVESEEIAALVLSSLEKNFHHEDALELLNVISCLPKVFELLRARGHSPITYFGNLCENNAESLGSVSFQCIANSLSYAEMREQLDGSDLDKLCQLIDLYSSTDVENSCRTVVATFLKLHFPYLVEIVTPQNSLILWTSTLRLLVDDDCDIRETLASSFAENLLPSVAMERFFDLLMSTSAVTDLIKSCLLLQWSIWDCDVDVADEEDSPDRVFEKGDMNTFLEAMVVNEISCRHLKTLIDRNAHIIHEELPTFCRTWIYNESRLPSAGATLAEIVHSLKTHVQVHCVATGHLSPFRPNEVSLSLIHKKLINILNCGSFEPLL